MNQAIQSVVNQLNVDVERIRKDFPILDQQVNGKPLVYLDNAASFAKNRCRYSAR